MTENEAIDILDEVQKVNDGLSQYIPGYDESLDFAKEALKEIQQYHTIGMVQECKEAIKKQIAKRPIKGDLYYWIDSVKVGRRYEDVRKKSYEKLCPCCKHLVAKLSCDYCPKCGQKLNWEGLNDNN